MFRRVRTAYRGLKALMDFSVPVPGPRLLYPTCTQCLTMYDPELPLPEAERARDGICAACVKLNAEPQATPEDRERRDALTIYDLLQQAAERAAIAGWDLNKFQDRGAAAYLTELEKKATRDN